MDEGEDITEEIVADKGYSLLLVSPHLEQADDIHFDEINRLYDYTKQHGYRFLCLTASTEEAIGRWKDRTGAEYQFANTDETTLKTIIRSNPGLVLLHNGSIKGKWSHNALPDVSPQTPKIDQGGLRGNDRSDTSMAVVMILWFIVPLTLLTIADGVVKKRASLTSES